MLTSGQYKAMLDTYYNLIHSYVKPEAARDLTLRAAERAFGVRFVLPPQVGMGQVGPGKCRRLVFSSDPGSMSEEALQAQLHQYRLEGWNITRINPYDTKYIYYACPPGEKPEEHQPLVLQAQERF